MKAFYQCGTDVSQEATLQVFLDDDFNPINGNSIEVCRQLVPGTGTNAVNIVTIQWAANPTLVAPGVYAMYARISAGGRIRYLYAPQLLTLKPSWVPPLLASLALTAGQARFTINGAAGQQIVVQASTNLVRWDPIATNILDGAAWNFVDTQSAGVPARFYRAVLMQ